MIGNKPTIQISEQTKTLLTMEGKMGETYDDLVHRLLDELEKLRKNVSVSTRQL